MSHLNWSTVLRKFFNPLLCLLFNLLFSASVHAQLLDDKALYNWAEATYPTLFPGPAADQQAGAFTYRFYPSTQNALGVSDGMVYALGPFSNFALFRIDTLAAFQCLVHPDRCAAAVADLGVASLHYGNTATFTLTGSGLDQVGLTFAIGGKCSGPRLVASVDTRTKNISCNVTGVGAVLVEVKNSTGEVLLSRNLTVPEPQVKLQTSRGDIVVQLNPASAPTTVNNFLAYVNSGFYNGTLFHRVIRGFVAQAGGYTTGPALRAPTFAPIKLESANGLSNVRGTIAMARSEVPDSATSQFYFNLVDNLGLNYSSATSPGYAVFGTIVQGLPVVDEIAIVPITTTQGGLTNVPVTDVVILGAQQVQ